MCTDIALPYCHASPGTDLRSAGTRCLVELEGAVESVYMDPAGIRYEFRSVQPLPPRPLFFAPYVCVCVCTASCDPLLQLASSKQRRAGREGARERGKKGKRERGRA
eukprot:1279257-Rhodomonas_salina.1